MNVRQSIVYTDFMTNVNDVIILNCGKHLQIVLTVSLLLRSLMKRSFVVMVA